MIYLDHNATTPVAPEVCDAMEPVVRECWGNASSAHGKGREARAVMERARGQVAALLGCGPDEIVFTSGGTESDNAAILGVAEACESRGRHLLTSNVEHPAVALAAGVLESRGWSVTRVAVDTDGRVDADRFIEAIRDDTSLVSLMHANNETGVLQPVAEVGREVRSRGIVMHTDAAQSVGKLETKVDELCVDLLTVASHKFYGPKGVGALYLRRDTPYEPFIRGAGHEGGRRSGTEPVPLIAGFGAACALASAELPGRTTHLAELRDRLEGKLRESFPSLVVHGGNVERLPNTLYVALPGIDAHVLIGRLDDIAAGTGAACHSGVTTPSKVLTAMGVSEELARGTLRLTLGRINTAEQIDRAAKRIAEAAQVSA